MALRIPLLPASQHSGAEGRRLCGCLSDCLRLRERSSASDVPCEALTAATGRLRCAALPSSTARARRAPGGMRLQTAAAFALWGATSATQSASEGGPWPLQPDAARASHDAATWMPFLPAPALCGVTYIHAHTCTN